MYLFLDLMKFDLQLGITMVILFITNADDIDDLDKSVLTIGSAYTVGWLVLGQLSVRYEHKRLMYSFIGLSLIEFIYIIYKTIRALKRLVKAPALATCSLIAGGLDTITHVGVIVIACFVLRNFGNGLKEKVFGPNKPNNQRHLTAVTEQYGDIAQ